MAQAGRRDNLIMSVAFLLDTNILSNLVRHAWRWWRDTHPEFIEAEVKI